MQMCIQQHPVGSTVTSGEGCGGLTQATFSGKLSLTEVVSWEVNK